jgi:hypothetical protein
MSAATSHFDRHAWVSGREGRRIASVSNYSLMKLAAAGAVRTLALPGASLRYNREDLERLAVEPNPGRPA